MTVFACKLCIAARGLHGTDIDKLPKTERELFEHLKTVHGLDIMQRNGYPVDDALSFIDGLYAACLGLIAELAALDPAPDSPEGKLLTELAAAVYAYDGPFGKAPPS